MRATGEMKSERVRPCCGSLRIGHVLAVAFALRFLISLLGWMFVAPAPLVREPDSASYLRAADELDRAARFGRPGAPDLVRTPGYPLFLVPGMRFGHVDLVTIVLQIGLGCVTTLLVYRLGVLICDRHDCAIAGALLYACEPVSALYCSKLLTETLFTALLTLSLERLGSWVRWPRWSSLLAAAAALAAAMYVRPIAYILPCVLTFVLVGSLWKRGPSRRQLITRAAAFALLSMAPAWAWQARNYITTGYPYFSAISDINLYYYQAAAVLAENRGVPLEAMQQELGYFDDAIYLKHHPEQSFWSQARRYEYLGQEARRIIGEHPAVMLRIHGRGIIAVLADPGVSAYLGFFRLDKAHTEQAPTLQPTAARAAPAGFFARLRRGIEQKPFVMAVYAAMSLIWLFYAALALRGLMLKEVWKSPASLLCLSTAVTLIVLSGGPAGYHRLRLPGMPVICLLGGFGAASLNRAIVCIQARRNSAVP